MQLTFKGVLVKRIPAFITNKWCFFKLFLKKQEKNFFCKQNLLYLPAKLEHY